MKKELKDLIDEREISLTELAEKCGITRNTLYNVVHGKHKAFRVTVCKICNFFGVDWREYL